MMAFSSVLELTWNYVSQNSLPCIVLVFGCVRPKGKREAALGRCTGVQAQVVDTDSSSSQHLLLHILQILGCVGAALW